MARAIMTTDTKKKDIAVRLKINNNDVTIGGVTKGAGMKSPQTRDNALFPYYRRLHALSTSQ